MIVNAVSGIVIGSIAPHFYGRISLGVFGNIVMGAAGGVLSGYVLNDLFRSPISNFILSMFQGNGAPMANFLSNFLEGGLGGLLAIMIIGTLFKRN